MKTNRQRVLDAIASSTSKRLADELEYQSEANSDESPTYDAADALWDAVRFADVSGDKSLARVCAAVLIAAGYLAPRTGEVCVLGRDRSPVRTGVRYDDVGDWDTWIKR